MYSIIDIGSNTIRLSVYEYENGNIKSVFSKKNMAGLAGLIEDGYLTQKGVQKTTEVLSEYSKLLKNLGIENVNAFGTAALRNIKNSNEAVKSIVDASGIPIDIISGEEEAELDFIGATLDYKCDSGAIVDIGGGSTEVVMFTGGKITDALSMPMGSLNMYKKNVKDIFPTEKEYKNIKKTAADMLKHAVNLLPEPIDTICGVGGSVRAAAKLDREIYNLPKNLGEIESAHIKKILKYFISDNRQAMRTILQVVPERIHTVLPGLIILNTVCEYFGSKSVVVSNCGVREGYLYKKVIKASEC